MNSQITALLQLGADAMSNMYDVTFTAIPAIIKDKLGSSDATPPATGTNVSVPDTASSSTASVEGPTPIQSHQLTLRANGFEPPKFNIKKYDIRYKTVGLRRPSTRIEGDRSFKITFRVDAYYNIYRMLALWRSVLMEPATGYATNALWGAGSGDDLAVASADTKLNSLFGQVSIVALARPIYMKKNAGFVAEQGGVNQGYITGISNDFATWEFDQVWISDLEEPKYKTGEGDLITITATFEFGEYRDPVYFWYGSSGSSGVSNPPPTNA